MEDVIKALEEVVSCICNSKEYQNCISLKKQMDENDEVKELVEKVKKYQKKYVNTHDKNIKLELDNLERQLNEIPLYTIYLQNLEIVNEKIDYVKDSLNEYFDQLLNKKY